MTRSDCESVNLGFNFAQFEAQVNRAARSCIARASIVKRECGREKYQNSSDMIDQKIYRLVEIQKARKARDCFFDGLFADPAWDILLEMTLQTLQGRTTKTTDICARIDVPATTTLRWISNLVTRGLITRQDDNLDHRKTILTLTEDGLERMHLYLESIGAGCIAEFSDAQEESPSHLSSHAA